MKTNFITIDYDINLYKNNKMVDLYIQSFELLLELIFEKTFDDKKIEINPSFFKKLNHNLPILTIFKKQQVKKYPCCFSLSCLCLSHFNYGVGRFIADMLSKWLIPGSQFLLSNHRSLTFSFKKDLKKTMYYLCEYHVTIYNKKEKDLIDKNLVYFLKELKLNILSVYQARSIISMRKLSLNQKSMIIKENISNLLKTQKKICTTAFDHMQNFLVNLSAEKKISEVEKNIAYLINKNPNDFDRNVFHSIHNILLLFDNKFTQIRDPRYISRIIGFQYLFRKSMDQSIYNEPNKRHLMMKILKTRFNENNQQIHVLGIVIMLNFINENERFDKNHIIEAIWHCLPNVKYVANSYIVDRRDEKIRFYYLEIKKVNLASFYLEDIKILKKRLSQELENRVESIIHPIFMPRNEEEIMRNIILLSKQLKYVNDIPQLIINYDKQRGIHILFTVILLRLVKEDSKIITKFNIKTNDYIKIHVEETRKIGFLKKKYIKEASIIKFILKKDLFIRDDLSLNLVKARQEVSNTLTKIIGHFRDYNGGMILKQNQALSELKKMIKNDYTKIKETLLEDFFYSLKPIIMQNILSTKLLINVFLLIKTLLNNKKELGTNPYIKKTNVFEKYFSICILTHSLEYRKRIDQEINKMKIPSFELAKFSIGNIKTFRNIYIFGYIYKTSDIEIQKQLNKLTALDVLNL